MPDHLGVKTLKADLQDGGLALFLDPLQDLLAGLGHDLFDAGRMDPAVDDQFVERDPRHLAADWVEAADDDRLGRVIDDQVDAGRLLKGANVAPLLTDDATFQLVCWQRQHRNRDLGGLVGGDPLDRLGDDLASAALAFVPGRELGLPDLARDLIA